MYLFEVNYEIIKNSYDCFIVCKFILYTIQKNRYLIVLTTLLNSATITIVLYFNNIDKMIASKLKSVLAKRGISLKDFAKDLEMDYNHLSKYSNNKAEISIRSLEKICKKLGVKKISEILEIIEDEDLDIEKKTSLAA